MFNSSYKSSPILICSLCVCRLLTPLRWDKTHLLILPPLLPRDDSLAQACLLGKKRATARTPKVTSGATHRPKVIWKRLRAAFWLKAKSEAAEVSVWVVSLILPLALSRSIRAELCLPQPSDQWQLDSLQHMLPVFSQWHRACSLVLLSPDCLHRSALFPQLVTFLRYMLSCLHPRHQPKYRCRCVFPPFLCYDCFCEHVVRLNVSWAETALGYFVYSFSGGVSLESNSVTYIYIYIFPVTNEKDHLRC